MEEPLGFADARLPQTNAPLQPIFLHSSFRTGSTWLWQKLRSAPTTYAYYEIFHHFLAGLKPCDVRPVDYASWDSRHPISAAYFLEFLPLLAPEGGASGFEASMSVGDFIPRGGPDGDLRAEEATYVEGLIAVARANKRIPVLCCTRSLGRARALRRAIGGSAILLHRNMFHQWASYCSLARAGNAFFFEHMFEAVEAASHDPFLRCVADWFGLARARPKGDDLFQLFIIVHLYLYSIAFDASEIVVDLNDLAADSAVRRRVEQALSDMVSSEIDLSDVTEQCEFTDLVIASPRLARDTIEQFSKLIPSNSTSFGAVEFVHRVKLKALAEWERFEFFHRPARVAYGSRLADAAKLLDDERSRNASLQVENDRLVAALSDAGAALETVRAKSLGLAAERDGLVRRLQQSEASLLEHKDRTAGLSEGIETDRLAPAALAEETELDASV